MKKKIEIQNRLNHLNNEKSRIEKDIKALENMNYNSLALYTTAQKVTIFDALYKSCETHFLKSVDSSFEDDDDEHYLYEELMQSTLGDDIFETMNNLT